MTALPPTSFSRVKRMPNRAIYEREIIYSDFWTRRRSAILGMSSIVVLWFIPTLHWRSGDRVFWHGGAASRMLEANAAGSQICLTATLLDGWVLARSAFNHSANYRSAMCFGSASVIEEPGEKRNALKVFMETRFPGRWDQLRPVTDKELRATLVLSMLIDEASAKVRAEGVDDPEADVNWPVWAGVLPFEVKPGVPGPAEEILAEGLAPPRTR